MTKRFRNPLLLLVSLIVLFAAAIPIRAQDDSTAKITSPQEGQTIVGVFTISGTASNANFKRYRVEYSPLEGAVSGQWFLIAEIQQQVPNGPLAQWNTTNVPDGRYQVRLRVVLGDNSVVSALVSNVIVSNTQPTPLPTIIASATPLPPTQLPTAGPSPTPLIQQPPTITPAPSVVPLGGGAADNLPTLPPTSSAPSGSRQAVLVLESLQNAFCVGAVLGAAGFILLGIYRLTFARMRPRVRRAMSELRGDRD